MTTINFVDNPHAPDVYADAVTGFYHINGNVKITFETGRVDHSASPGPVNRVVIGRLVMSLAAAENLARGLLDFVESQKSPEAPVSAPAGTLQ